MGKGYEETIYKRENTNACPIRTRKAIQPQKITKESKNKVTRYSFLLIRLVINGKTDSSRCYRGEVREEYKLHDLSGRQFGNAYQEP